jgi:hypothetical protein
MEPAEAARQGQIYGLDQNTKPEWYLTSQGRALGPIPDLTMPDMDHPPTHLWLEDLLAGSARWQERPTGLIGPWAWYRLERDSRGDVFMERSVPQQNALRTFLAQGINLRPSYIAGLPIPWAFPFVALLPSGEFTVGDDSLRPSIILPIWGPCNQPRELEEDLDRTLAYRQPWGINCPECAPGEPAVNPFYVTGVRGPFLLSVDATGDAYLNSGHHVLGPLPENLLHDEDLVSRTTIAVRDLEDAGLAWRPSPSGLYAGDAWFTLIDGPDGARFVDRTAGFRSGLASFLASDVARRMLGVEGLATPWAFPYVKLFSDGSWETGDDTLDEPIILVPRDSWPDNAVLPQYAFEAELERLQPFPHVHNVEYRQQSEGRS